MRTEESDYLTQSEFLDPRVIMSPRLLGKLIALGIRPLLTLFYLYYSGGIVSDAFTIYCISVNFYVAKDAFNFWNQLQAFRTNREFVAFGADGASQFGLIKGCKDFFMNIYASTISKNFESYVTAGNVLLGLVLAGLYIVTGYIPVVCLLALPIAITVIERMIASVGVRFTKECDTLTSLIRIFTQMDSFQYSQLYQEVLRPLSENEKKQWGVNWVKNHMREYISKYAWGVIAFLLFNVAMFDCAELPFGRLLPGLPALFSRMLLNSQVLIVESLYLLASVVFAIKYCQLPSRPPERPQSLQFEATRERERDDAGPRSPSVLRQRPGIQYRPTSVSVRDVGGTFQPDQGGPQAHGGPITPSAQYRGHTPHY